MNNTVPNLIQVLIEEMRPILVLENLSINDIIKREGDSFQPGRAKNARRVLICAADICSRPARKLRGKIGARSLHARAHVKQY